MHVPYGCHVDTCSISLNLRIHQRSLRRDGNAIKIVLDDPSALHREMVRERVAVEHTVVADDKDLAEVRRDLALCQQRDQCLRAGTVERTQGLVQENKARRRSKLLGERGQGKGEP